MIAFEVHPSVIPLALILVAVLGFCLGWLVRDADCERNHHDG